MIYEFQCECGESFVEERAMAEGGDPAKCPRCGAVAKRIWRCPQMIVRGESKNRSYKEYEDTGLMPVPRMHGEKTPEQYERMHDRSFERAERKAKEIARERKAAGRPDGTLRKVGQCSFQEYMAMQKKYPTEMGDGSPPTGEILEREGCVFKHEKGQGS